MLHVPLVHEQYELIEEVFLQKDLGFLPRQRPVENNLWLEARGTAFARQLILRRHGFVYRTQEFPASGYDIPRSAYAPLQQSVRSLAPYIGEFRSAQVAALHHVWIPQPALSIDDALSRYVYNSLHIVGSRGSISFDSDQREHKTGMLAIRFHYSKPDDLHGLDLMEAEEIMRMPQHPQRDEAAGRSRQSASCARAYQ